MPSDSSQHDSTSPPETGEVGEVHSNGRGGPKTNGHSDQSEARGPSSPGVRVNDRVVTALLDREEIERDEVRALQNGGSTDAAPLWRRVAESGSVDRELVYAEAARIYAFPRVRLQEADPDLEFIRSTFTSFPEEHQERLVDLGVVPFEYELESLSGILKLVFVSHDPMNPAVQDLMRALKVERFEMKYAPASFVEELMEEAFPQRNEYLERLSEDDMAYDMGTSIEEDDELVDEEVLEEEINSSTLINLFEATLVEGVRKGVSDIHIYPKGDRTTQILFRIDGELEEWHREERVHPEALLAIVKDNARGVDRFERDAAQDGFIQRRVDDTLIRFRVSVLPMATSNQDDYAESIVIRILDDRKIITDIGKLGLLDDSLEKFDRAIRQPHGMVILTGPTGSGKSTTLVAALHEVMNPSVNVLTVEDPVEYVIDGARQIKLSRKLGMDGALRSILRHDPDIVMVGEMRDRPTAELAIKLANTGHLTFSTLHTNDAPSAVSRLYKMGIEPFLIAYAINLVVAQRLIRTLCPHCKEEKTDPDSVLLERLGFREEEVSEQTIYEAGEEPDCPECGGRSYTGRRAIAEAMYFSREVRHLIAGSGEDVDEEALRKAAQEEGLRSLQESARRVVLMGETSLEEMVRVTSSGD